MPVQSIEELQQYLQRLCPKDTPSEDAALLNRFAVADDRDAFTLLIARHGPMVLGTARRLVDNTHDAEDVFQAVFLSLARLAKTIRQGSALPAWLHKTTCRIAAKARRDRSVGSREPSPEPSEIIDPSAQMVWREICQALDEELEHLPDRLRSPLVLCYLSGLTRDEAARQLGWSLGTLKRRLEQGRNALRIRMERRGIAAVGLALAVLAPESLQAVVGKSLFESSLSMILSTRAVVPSTISALVVSSATVTKGTTMKLMFAFLAAIAVGVGIYAGTRQGDAPKITERRIEAVQPVEGEKVVKRDDPLPAGSILRFGTSRYRHGAPIETMAVSADGKTAFVSSGTHSNGFTRTIDLDTGRSLFNIAGDCEDIAISPNGRTVVTKQNLRLVIRDFKSGRSLRAIDLPKANLRSTADVLAFTPDGKAIATTSRSDIIHLIDVASGKTIRDFLHVNPISGRPNNFPQVLAVAFSPDGKQMATGGYANENGNYFARLWNVESGKEVRRFMHGKKGYGIRCLAFSPDGKTLATLGTQSGVFLRLFDVETGKKLRAFPKDGRRRTRGGSVAFAPDGKTVAVACSSIHLYDVKTGEELLRIDRRASHLHFTDDGKILTGAVNGAIYRWDAASGKTLTPQAADSIVDQILVTPDGGRVVTRHQDGNGYLWDGTTGKQLRTIPVAWQRGMSLSPDGRFLAWPISDSSVTFTEPKDPRAISPGTIYDGSRIRMYNIANDKFADRFPAFKGNAQDLAFTNDGKQLVTIDQQGGHVRIWDVKTGKEKRSFHIVPDDLKKKSFFALQSRLSPNGKTAVVTYQKDLGGRLGGLRGPPQLVRLWDVANGKQLPKLAGSPIDGGFSPDGRYVVTRGGNCVYEIATGRRVAALPNGRYVRAAAFSRDGRFLATAVTQGVIQIWEVATWTKRNEFKGYQNQSITLTFGPAGRLFTGHFDTTVLAWDIRPPRVAESVSLESAWDDLAAKESGVSFKSQGRFLTSPASTIKFIAGKVKPVTAIDPKRIHRLLADLDNDKFAVREAASNALQALDQQALPYFKKALKVAQSLEHRLRLKKIIDGRLAASLTSEQLRQMRGVMVVELIGNAESKNLLKRWAGGPAGALLTMEASAALKRLESVSQ